MSSLDSTKAWSCESVHWKVASLWVNSLKSLTTSLNFGQNPYKEIEHAQITLDSMLVCRFGHVDDCFDHGWSWANSWTELETHENHLLRFESPLGWVLLKFSLVAFAAENCKESHHDLSPPPFFVPIHK